MKLPTRPDDARHARMDGPLGPNNGAQRRDGALPAFAATSRQAPRTFEAVGGLGGAALASSIY